MSNPFSNFPPNPFQNQTSAPFRGWMSPNHAFDRRRGQLERAAAKVVSHWVQTGTANVSIPPSVGTPAGIGTGEALVPVTFTNTAIELPVFTFGWSLEDNTLVAAGQYPTLNAGVHDWTTSSSGYATLWTGAHIGVVVTGMQGLNFVLHYTFTAMAMTGTADAYNGTGSVT
jgi:hypothetical protein